MNMTRLVVCLVTITLVSWGCGGSPAAPDPIQQPAPPADFATISGHVYASTAPTYALIRTATVEINEADGTTASVVTDANGFYRISARRGSVTITASKEGFEAKQWQFDLAAHTVLNFSLDPQ